MISFYDNMKVERVYQDKLERYPNDMIVSKVDVSGLYDDIIHPIILRNTSFRL